MIFVLLVFSGYQQHKSQVLSSRLDTLSVHLQKVAVRDSVTLSEISKQQFKEDYYIQQLDRDVTLLLFLISALFVIASILSFRVFEERIDRSTNEQRAKYVEQEVKYSELRHMLLGLKTKVSYDNYKLNEGKALNSLSEKNLGLYVNDYIFALKNLSDYYFWLKSQDDDLQHMVKSTIVENLSEIQSNIEEYYPVKVPTDLILNSYMDDIRKIDDIEISRLLSKIQSLVESQN